MNLDDARAISIGGKDVLELSIGGEMVWQKFLPIGYTRLEYIESTGTQYIDTGVVGASATTAFEVDIDTAGITQIYGSATIIGARSYFDAGRLYIVGNYEPGVFWCGIGRNDVSFDQSDARFPPQVLSGRHMWAYKNRTYYVDDVSIVQVVQTFTAPTLWLLNTHFGSSQQHDRLCLAKLHGAKFWDDGTPVRDYIPALRTADSKPGLFDTVTREFYTNAGTGEFLYS